MKGNNVSAYVVYHIELFLVVRGAIKMAALWSDKGS
jgi:hypothetical protein